MNFKKYFFPDHFSQTNMIGIIIGIFIALTSLWAIIYMKPPGLSKNNGKKIARLEGIVNIVKLKEASSASYFNTGIGDYLHSQDIIYTGKNSKATISYIPAKNSKFSTGTKVELGAFSLIKIDENAIELIGNDSSVKIKLRVGESLQMKKNNLIQTVKATAKESTIEAFCSSGLLELFSKDKGVIITKEKVKTPLITRIAPPKKEEKNVVDTSVFIIKSPTAHQEFDIAEGIIISTNTDSKYTVNIFKTYVNDDPLYQKSFDGKDNLWNIDFKVGSYFLKIKNDKYSKTVPITLVSNYEVEGYKPADGETIDVVTGEKTILSWKALDVKKYSVTITDNQGKKNTYDTSTSQLAIEGLSGPSINWTVSPKLPNGKYLITNKTVLAKLKYKGEIKFSNLKPNGKYKITDKKVTLEWASPRGEAFEIKVFDVKTNTEIASTHTKIKSSTILLKKEGAFKIVVSAADFPDLQKAEFFYDVSVPVLYWDSTLPKIINSIEMDDQIKLKFSKNLDLRKITDIYQKYTPLNGKPVQSVIKVENANNVKLNGFGEYCYIVHLLAPIEHFYDSEIYCFNLVQLPAFSSVPQAKNAILVNNKKEGIVSYDLTLPTVNNAEKYHVEIYRENTGKNMIFSSDSKSPQISWKTKRSGIYYLKYKVYDKKNRESPFSSFSKIIFPISPLSNWDDKE